MAIMNATEIRTRSCHIGKGSVGSHTCNDEQSLHRQQSLQQPQEGCSRMLAAGFVADVNVKTSQTSSKSSILALFTSTKTADHQEQ